MRLFFHKPRQQDICDKERKGSQAAGYMSFDYSVPTIELLRLFNLTWLPSITACIIFYKGFETDAKIG